MAFPPTEGKLVAIVLQCFLYGMYFSIFLNTTWTLLKKRPLGKTMLAISLLIFIIATMHVVVNSVRIIRAFVVYADAPGGPGAFFNQLAETTEMLGSSLYVLQTLVGDAVVLYRCYLVWERNILVVALPFLLLLGSTATGIGILNAFEKVGKAEIFASELSRWIISFFSMTFATNVICTALVAYRVWVINKTRMSFRVRKIRSALLLVVESGALYSATLMVLLILYTSESWFQYVIIDAVSPIVGIVFSLIIYRIAVGISTEEGETVLLGSNIPMSPMSLGSIHKTSDD
ncbi:hypothetical protein C8J56DRAFT_169867 [Mycena floridula]|nr:hypothetical protein C8J56DRAFT_169867 [Mycena floridula]